LAHHAELSADRWSDFTLEQQILMIANELNRASKLVRPGDHERRRNSLARALTLTDLTAGGNVRPPFRRELLRWRDLLASLYLNGGEDPKELSAILRVLLRFTPETSRQIAHLPAAQV
jgi:hypothetical protein